MPEYTLVIQPGNQTMQVELDNGTTIKEIFEFIQTQYNFPNPINQWTCKNLNTNTYLQQNATLPENATTLLIQTIQSQQRHTEIISPTQQQSQGQQQFPPSFPSQNEISLTILIQDGNHKRSFQTIFNDQHTLDQVGLAALTFCGLNEKVAAVDLEIFGQAYNNADKRNKTLLQLQIKGSQEVQARIRWIGG